MFLAPLAQLRLGQLLVRLAIARPQLEDGDELALLVGEQRMRVVGGGALVGRAFARILNAQERGDRQHLVQAAVALRGAQHARQLDVHRQPGHLPAGLGQPAVAIDGAQLGQLLPAVRHRPRVGRFDEREGIDVAQSQPEHAQDHPGQRRAPDLRIGVLRAREEIGFRVQADAGARRDAAAAPLALVGAGLRDRLDVQAVELLPWAVALDPGQARIDHVVDARHRQRGFGHVGRQHDAPLRAGVEHAVLVAPGQPRVQRHHFGMAVLATLQRPVRIADLALAGQEHQRVAGPAFAHDLVAGGHDAVQHRDPALRVGPVPRAPARARGGGGTRRFAGAGQVLQRAPAHLHRIAAALHADHRRVVEMPGEPLGIYRGRGHDQLQVAALAQQLLEVAEQEIDVEAALVGLVDDDRVVAREPAIGRDLGQQDAVGHELDRGLLGDVVVETHLVADQPAHRHLKFLGHAPGDRARGDASRLRAANHAGGAAPGLQAQLGQLRGLARAGFAGHHNHLVVADQRHDPVGLGGDRQALGHGRGRQSCRPRFARLHRRLQRTQKRLPGRGIGGPGIPARPQAQQPSAVARQRAIDLTARLL